MCPIPIEAVPVEVLTEGEDPAILDGRGTGTQAEESFLREFRESRRIVEDIQRGTLEHIYVTKGHPNEAYLDSGLTGLNIGNPHPWWGSTEADAGDVAKDMYLVRREFTKLTDRLSKKDRWTKVALLYQRRVCPFDYEEDYLTTSVTMQHWWLPSFNNPNKPAMIVPGLAQGWAIQTPQIVMRRHWAHVIMDSNEVRDLVRAQNTTNSGPFAGRQSHFWLLEGIQAKQLFGTSISDAPTNDHYEITITWRGDPVRQHELWIADFGGGAAPVQPTGMTFEQLGEVHHRYRIYPDGPDFETLIPTSNRCQRKASS